MNVLHVINDLRLAGAERLLADLVEVQTVAGLTVSVAPLAPCGSANEAKIRDTGATLLLPDKRLAIRSPAQIPRLRQLFRGYDLVHVQLFPAQLWVAIAGVSLGKAAPALLTTEQNTHNGRRDVPALKPIDRWMYARYAGIAAISDGTRDALIAYLPETAGKIMVVPNGIDLRRFTQTGSLAERAALFPQVPASVPILLSVGRLEAQKDFGTLVRAVALVPDAHLCIVGDGHLRTPLETLARTLGIAGRVHFLGKRNDIPALLRNADMYTQSSAWEGFGIAAVEAMASGLPLVVSDVPGLREVVGDAVVTVAPASPEAFAGAVNGLLKNAPRRAALSRLARARAARFSIAETARGYADMYGRT